MSIIIISSDLYTRGRDIAEKAAEALGYDYLGREVLAAVAAKYNIPEVRLANAIEESPSFLGPSIKVWKRYLAYIEEATLTALLKDNVVCYGLAAHLYVLGISHVLKVCLLSDPEERVRELAFREKTSVERARKLVKRLDKARRRWCLEAFDRDETDPSLCDLVINLRQIEAKKAVNIITETVGKRKFQPMTYSTKCMQQRELANRVRAALLVDFPDVRVRATGGTVVVNTLALKREKRKKANAIKELARKISGVEYVEVNVINDIIREAAESFR